MRVFALVLLIGCGRVGFDPRDGWSSTGDVAVPTGDVAVPTPVAWWKIDEGSGTMTADSIGSAHATLESMPTWGTGVAGAGLDFVGNGDSANVLVATPQLHNLPSLSITGWIRPQSVTLIPGQVGCLLEKQEPSFGWAFVTMLSADGDLAFSEGFTGNSQSRSSIAGVLVAQAWQHIAVTYTGAASATAIRMYVGGTEVAYASGVDGIGTRVDDSPRSPCINCNAGFGLQGSIDDVRLFDRVLSEAEVRATMQP